MKTQRREALGMLTAAVGSALLPGSLALAAQTPSANGPAREVVSGIGGFFFRAREPKILAQWYQDHLGIFVTPQKADDPVWQQQAGATSFTPFPEKTTYFGNPTKQWMMNFRVANLDKLTEQLKAAGIAVKVDATAYPYGRFAHLQDPEGNPIELWQPTHPPNSQ